jgi:hypothetical protein
MPASTVNAATLSSNNRTAEKRAFDVFEKPSSIAARYARLEEEDVEALASKEVKDWPMIKTTKGCFIPEFWAGKKVIRKSWIGAHS